MLNKITKFQQILSVVGGKYKGYQKMKKVNSMIFSGFLILCAILTISCSEKSTTKPDAADAFVSAKAAYNDGLYEIAIQKLSEYKSKYPYSNYAVEADLLIANCHFELGNFEEAAISYKHFIRLHPNHEKVEESLYKIGESYWKEAPDDVDREQEYTKKAIKEWSRLLAKYPNSSFAKEARKNIEKGRRRIAGNLVFIGNFYCKQEIYHACAYRFSQIITEFRQFPDVRKVALEKLYLSFEELAKIKSHNPNSDSNIYFKGLSAKELRDKSQQFKALLDKDNAAK